MQETGSLTDAKNLLSRLIICFGFQKDMRFDRLGDACLAGAARRPAEREMGVLDDAVARERQFRHFRKAPHLGHEAQTYSGRDQRRGIRGPAVTAKSLGLV